MKEAIQAVSTAYEVEAERFAIVYAAFAAKQLAGALTDQQRAQWADNLVEAAVAARDIIAPIPVQPPPPAVEESPEFDELDQVIDEEEQDEDTGIGALQRIFEQQRNQPE